MGLDMLTPEQKRVVTETGALLQGHFILASGLHSQYYFQCAQICQYPRILEDICKEIVGRLANARDIQTVISPAIGGIIFGQELARLLGARAIFTEKEAGEMVLRRGFTLKPCEKVLLAEDVTTTGGSIQKVETLARAAGAEILGFTAIVDRSGGQFKASAPFVPWARLHFPTYPADALPPELAAIPTSKPGSGKGGTSM